MANVLIVRSDWDLPTKYLATYSEFLISLFANGTPRGIYRGLTLN